MNRTVHFCEEEEEKSSVQSKTKQINNTLANETSQIEAFSNENQHTPHTSKTRTNKQTNKKSMTIFLILTPLRIRVLLDHSTCTIL